MDNTEVNISQEIPAYERRYRKISEWFLNWVSQLMQFLNSYTNIWLILSHLHTFFL